MDSVEDGAAGGYRGCGVLGAGGFEDGRGKLPDDGEGALEVDWFGEVVLGEVGGSGLDFNAGVSAALGAGGAEETPSEGAVGVAVGFEGLGGLQGGFEYEYGMVFWVPCGDVGVPTGGHVVVAGGTIGGFAGDGMSAVVMRVTAEQVVGKDDGREWGVGRCAFEVVCVSVFGVGYAVCPLWHGSCLSWESGWGWVCFTSERLELFVCKIPLTTAIGRCRGTALVCKAFEARHKTPA